MIQPPPHIIIFTHSYCRSLSCLSCRCWFIATTMGIIDATSSFRASSPTPQFAHQMIQQRLLISLPPEDITIYACGTISACFTCQIARLPRSYFDTPASITYFSLIFDFTLNFITNFSIDTFRPLLACSLIICTFAFIFINTCNYYLY